MSVKYLHRLPSEVCVLPEAYAELAALEQLETPHVCKKCRRELLMDELMKYCDICGLQYEDPQVHNQLTVK